jgi:hypothetical protein
MAKKKFQTAYQRLNTKEQRIEKITGESQTVAGESMTIQELMQRHRTMHDLPINGNAFEIETDDFDGVDFGKINSLDPVERMELYDEVSQRAQNARKLLEEYEAKQKAKELEDANERSVETRREAPEPKEAADS